MYVICMFVYVYCESQPKASAEYRYKAKLIQGVCGGGWQGGVQNWMQERSKKGWAPLRCFEAWKRGKPDPQDFLQNMGGQVGGYFF